MHTLPRVRKLVAAIAFGLLSSIALAQDTSSSVAGRIVDPEGKPVAGASVEILHASSGTRKTVITDSEGRFGSKGLRVGGTFVISATKEGLESVKQEDVALRLGETGTVDLVMGTDEAVLAEVEVVASNISSVFDSTKMGSGTVISREQIDALPSINRSIEDYVRLDPRIVQVDKERGGISAAGQNSRYNNITIDGVSNNDEFGLNDNGFASLNQPISLDSIEELNVGISSFDVSQGDFTGANINAVTKSGTNEFKGSVYSFYRDSDWVGEDELGNKFTAFDDELTYGMTLGGPILQDRLFFFISYENFERSQPAPTVNQRVRNGALQDIASAADLAAIATRAQALGFTNTGSFVLDGVSNEDEKIIGKIDWNISDAHRASMRYGRTTGSVLRTPGISSTGVSFSDHWYTDNLLNRSLTAQLYSDWSDVFSTEFSVARTEYSSIPQNNSFTPQVQVRINGGADSVFFGTERSRQANALDTKTTTAFARGNLFLGDHSVSFGADFKRNDVFNLFLQDANGSYVFSSIADFQAGRVNNFRFQFPATSTDINSVAAAFRLKNYGLFLQDNWVYNNNLTLNYGVRIDIPDIAEKPTFNQNFTNAFGFRNDSTIDGNSIIQPRAGFNYTFDSEKPTQLRGGVGVFAGSSPNVWLSNAFSNTGLLASGFNLTGNPLAVAFNIDPRNQPRLPGTPPTPNVDVIDPDFEQPTTIKGVLAFERELPVWGLVGSAEWLVTQTENNVFYESRNLGEATGRLPDGRLAFWTTLNSATGFANPVSPTARARARANPAFGTVTLLRNSTKGETQNFTLSLEKPWEDNWFAKLGYTYGDGRDSSPGTSSTANSSFSNRLIVDPNDDVTATSNYIFRDRITGIFQYRHDFFEGLASKVGFFFEGRAGRPFSYAFIGDANGDQANASNDLFYIPAGPGDVIFRPATINGVALSAQQVETEFFNYINSVPYLRDHKGEIADRNASRSPWISQLDVRFSQEIPAFFDVKGEVFLDIQNFGNLINDEWGQIDEASFPYSIGVARFAGVQDGKYVYSYLGAPAGFTRKDVRGESRWNAQLGLRFTF